MKADIAEVIVDISVEELDRPFEYLIPDELIGQINEGTPVKVPFGRGNRKMTGYVVAVKEESEWDRDKLKAVTEVVDKDVPVEGQLLGLAAWIRSRYGSTMNEAIKTVLPIRSKVKQRRKKTEPPVEAPSAVPSADIENNPVKTGEEESDEKSSVVLNAEQKAAIGTFTDDYMAGERNIYLLL